MSKVYFVGCGPGDPDLITIKAKKLVQKADVIVYSGSLIPPEILKFSKKHPEMKITVIPGIVSMFTFASKVGISIAEGAEKVSIIPSCYDLSSVKEIAKNSEVLVFLKDGRYFDQVIELVRESGFPEDSIFAIGQDLGTDKEIIRKLRLGDVNDDTLTTSTFQFW